MTPTLTVGMATFDDFDGCYFTISGLRANHPTVDIVVVDNHPLGCHRTQAVTEANGGRYYHKPNLHGTSAPRDEVFRLAETPWVLVTDSHCLFETGAIAGLIEYAESHPESRDLIQGPLVYDNGTLSTHWRPTTQPGLWGTWAEMWTGKDDKWGAKYTFTPKEWKPNNWMAANPMTGGGTACPGQRHLSGGDRQSLLAEGFQPACDDREPFEIPMQGLGCWAMRKEAWPGFNPLFAGFGGEEGYIHELTRRLGGKALCLPSLRWRHRFRDPSVEPVPYPLSLEDHVWNLLVGHRELGIDATEAIRKDFGFRLPPGVFDSMIRGVERCQQWDDPGVRPAPLKMLGVWYSNNAAPEKVLRASLDSIKRAADLSRAEVRVNCSVWSHIDGNPFAKVGQFGNEMLATFRDGPGHLNIVRQQRQCIEFQPEIGRFVPDVVCFLEHDVLYPPDYFDRVAQTFAQNPNANVVSNLDYEGLNATGWLAVKERHEPLHQLSMRYDLAVANIARCEAEAVATGQCLLEPQGDRLDWARYPPRGRMPAVHVNH